MLYEPKTLLEAVTYYSNPEHCSEFVKQLLWEDGNPRCPRCESTDVILMAKYERFHCRECRKQFSIKLGTIFEHSPLPFSKWLPVMWLMANAKNGISSHEIARSIGVTQKTAWFMSMRIREVMRTESYEKLSGTIEADETYIGGLEKNKHISKNPYKKAGVMGKTAVMGMVQRGGNVRAKVVDNARRRSLEPEVLANVEKGSTIYTDSLRSYRNLSANYEHDFVEHAREYVRGDVHTNTMEGFWNLLKRCIKGTHIHLSDYHLDRYLDEECCRYNMRKVKDGTRFNEVAPRVVGRRLTWNELTGKAI